MAVFSVIVKVPAPACVIVPVSVRLPLAVRFKAPVPTDEVPMTKALPLTRETELLPELFRETAFVKALFCVKLIALAPALKLEVPPTVKVPVWLMPALAAVAMAVKLVPMLEVAKFKVLVLVMVAEVPLVKETLPVRLFDAPLVVKLIEVPALSVVVPGTTIVPLWLMAPPAVIAKLPLLFNVIAGTLILTAALEKLSVKLRKALSEFRLVGRDAAAFVLVKLKSCILPRVAPAAKVTAPLILLA